MKKPSADEKLRESLEENLVTLREFLPMEKSFDIITKKIDIGKTKCFFLGLNGFCNLELLQDIFSHLQNPSYLKNPGIHDIRDFVDQKIGYAQSTLTSSWEEIIKNVLSGPSVLFIDGFDQALIIDVRTYPSRSVAEPDSERITRGAKDGFVEILLSNVNLIRRRIRSGKLTFEMHSVGSESQTDVVIAYMEDSVNKELLNRLTSTLTSLKVTSLTLGAKSLEELLVKKRWCTPLPCIQMTERPDVASSYLMEGHIVIIVDNSPTVLILPCTFFQFTQSPEDFYKSPMVGGYFRLIRFCCIPVSLFLMPAFLLLCANFPQTAKNWGILSTEGLSPGQLLVYILAVEFLLDLFKYSASLNSSRFSGALSIVGGLLIGDTAISMHWASIEVLFYAAITLLTSLSLASIEFADALRFYRILLILATGFFKVPGFIIGVILVTISIVSTPTFGGMSYFWPLFPFNGKALAALLFRQPTSKAQPSKIWNRGPLHKSSS